MNVWVVCVKAVRQCRSPFLTADTSRSTDSIQRRLLLIYRKEYFYLKSGAMSSTPRIKRRKKLLLVAVACILAEKHRWKKSRLCWTRQWLERRPTLGFLVPELMREDSAQFRCMFRIDIFLLKIAWFVGRHCRLPRHTCRHWRSS